MQDAEATQAAVSTAASVEMWTMLGAIGAIITAFATVAIAFLAAKGLRSLKLAQRDMLNRATREARDCAIDRCREMADVIIPRNAKILASFKETSIPVFVDDPGSIVFGENENPGPAAEWVAKHLDADLYRMCVELLNKCEAWAMYFTKGLAEEGVAYAPCAPVFMALVIQLYPLLIHLRARDTAGDFPNVVMLFESWYGKTAAARTEKQKEMLLETVRNLHARGGAYKRLPDPIGTERLP